MYRAKLIKGTTTCIMWALFNKTLSLVLNLTRNVYKSTDGVLRQVSKYFFHLQSSPYYITCSQFVTITNQGWFLLVCSSHDSYISISYLNPWHYRSSFHNFIKMGLHHGFFLKTFQNFKNTCFYIAPLDGFFWLYE